MWEQSPSPFFAWIASCPLLLPFINPMEKESGDASDDGVSPRIAANAAVGGSADGGEKSGGNPEAGGNPADSAKPESAEAPKAVSDGATGTPQPGPAAKAGTLFDFLRALGEQKFSLGTIIYRGHSVETKTLFPLLNSVLLQRGVSTQRGPGKRTDEKPGLKAVSSPPKNVSAEELSWLIDKVQSAVKSGKGKFYEAVARNDVKAFVKAGVKLFFIEHLHRERVPSRSAKRKEIEGYLTVLATDKYMPSK